MCECIRVSVLATEYDRRVYFFQEPVCKCVRARVLASVLERVYWRVCSLSWGGYD